MKKQTWGIRKYLTVAILFSILVTSGIFMYRGCGGSKFPNSRLKSDTAWTAVIYAYDWDRNDYRISTARRVIKDTISFVESDHNREQDEIKMVKKSYKDTTYLIPLFEPILDSAKNKIKTSLGKDSFQVKWYILPRQLLLQDYNRNFFGTQYSKTH